MKRKPKSEPASPEEVLDRREEAILRSVIREHIVTGEPIGSRTVARLPRLDLSPATIRNIMGELEERGFLEQPHVSAGRLPTSKAYRLYVDRMLRRAQVSPDQVHAIDQALAHSSGEIAELLGETSRQLSHFSNQVGVVLAPQFQRIVVEHIEFVRLDSRRVVAILVGRSGVVHNRILAVNEPLAQPELDRIGRYLSEEFGGLTLSEIRQTLELKMTEERATYDRLVARSLELGRQAIDAEEGRPEVFVEGASNLLGSPEFADPEKIKSLMRALERRRTLIGLLGRVLDEDGVQVIIGEESDSSELVDCSLVAANYESGGRVIGTLGIVGPKRMEYARAIALVDYLAQVLGRFFERDEN